MKKLCKHCQCELNASNAAKKNSKYYRNECKPCRVKLATQYRRDNIEARRKYMNERARKIGKVKQYPCKTCNKLCYKKYALAFCSDVCRFMNYVKVTSGCWIWIASKNRSGYGKFSFSGFKNITAHRASYILFNGPIKDDLFVCHSCDNPSCVKPAHLWLGNHAENMSDMTKKERQNSKLKCEDILKIREMVEKDSIPQTKIVELYGITSGTVSSIIHRRIWKHL